MMVGEAWWVVTLASIEQERPSVLLSMHESGFRDNITSINRLLYLCRKIGNWWELGDVVEVVDFILAPFSLLLPQASIFNQVLQALPFHFSLFSSSHRNFLTCLFSEGPGNV
jgi:hypothetical protein